MLKNLRKLISYYRPYIGTFLLDMFFAVVASAISLVIPLVVRYITSEVIYSEQGAKETIIRLGLILTVLVVIQFFANYYITNVGHVMGAKMEYNMRAELFSHYQKLSFSFFDDQKVGQLMSRITNDLFEISELLHHGPENIVISFIKIIGAFIILISKKKKANDVASILLGFGILFFGMTTMEVALDPLKTSESFHEAFTTFTNPFIGLLLGIVLAMILQSSSAAVGIVQAVAAATGNITLAIVAPMVIGISIGKLFPVFLASIGTKKEAQQVALSQFFISTAGGILGMLVFYLAVVPLGIVNMDAVMNRGNIADFNSIYNILVSLFFLPWCTFVSKVVKTIRKDNKPSKIDQELAMLDVIFLKTPSVALEQCRKVINGMGTTVIENYGIAMDMHDEYNEKEIELLNENERFLDKSETVLNDYMVKVNACQLRPEEQKLATEILHSVMDFERMGDHCIKLFDVAEYNRNAKISFSSIAKKELGLLSDAVYEVIKTTVGSLTMDRPDLAGKVEPLRDVISSMSEEIRDRHVRRLQNGQCTVQSGISLVECLTSFERISAYCSNVALHVIERHSQIEGFDSHEYTKDIKANSEEYKKYLGEFEEKYSKVLEGINS